MGWRVRAVVDANPDRVFFSNAEKTGGGRVGRRVLLRPVEGGAVKVVRATSPHPSIEVSWQDQATPILTVALDTGKRGTFLAGVVVIEFEGGRTVTLPVAIAPE